MQYTVLLSREFFSKVSTVIPTQTVQSGLKIIWSIENVASLYNVCMYVYIYICVCVCVCVEQIVLELDIFVRIYEIQYEAEMLPVLP